MNSPIIVALDGYSNAISLQKVLELALALKDNVWGYKVNDFFTRHSWDGIQQIRRASPGARIMLDLKLYDIPNTVENYCKVIQDHNVDILTVHAHGGSAMMKAATQTLPDKIAAVSVLTSFGLNEYQELHHTTYTIKEQVNHLAVLANEAQCGYLVCSAEELPLLNTNILTSRIKKIVPGIRPSWHQTKDDQKRVATPSAAIKDGASLLVIGRPILQAKDPLEAVIRTLEEIENDV